MSKTQGGRAAILSILFGGMGVGALGYYVKSTPQAAHVAPELRAEKKQEKAVEVEPSVQEPVKPHRRRHHASAAKAEDPSTIRVPVFGDDLSEMELSKVETVVPTGQTAMRFVAQKIVDAAHYDGARALGVEVRDHVAVVRYDETVAKGMGSMEEGGFLRALQVGFGQFEDVDAVRVEAGGKPLESGHVDLSHPLSVIRPGEKEPEGEDPSRPAEP